jgi:hypothetical protein
MRKSFADKEEIFKCEALKKALRGDNQETKQITVDQYLIELKKRNDAGWRNLGCGYGARYGGQIYMNEISTIGKI